MIWFCRYAPDKVFLIWRSEVKVKVTDILKWYMTLRNPKMHPQTKFGICRWYGTGDMVWICFLDMKVRSQGQGQRYLYVTLHIPRCINIPNLVFQDDIVQETWSGQFFLNMKVRSRSRSLISKSSMWLSAIPKCIHRPNLVFLHDMVLEVRSRQSFLNMKVSGQGQGHRYLEMVHDTPQSEDASTGPIWYS